MMGGKFIIDTSPPCVYLVIGDEHPITLTEFPSAPATHREHTSEFLLCTRRHTENMVLLNCCRDCAVIDNR
jgi:hypothetical protein